MLRSIKIKLYPNEEQKIYIHKMLGANRFVYNQCLEYKNNQYKNNGKSTGLSDTSFYTNHYLKKEYPWIKETHSKVIQQSLINLESAFEKFFKKEAGFPKFKKKGNEYSVRFPVDAISGFKGNRVNIITKLKDIHYKCSTRDEKKLNKYKAKSATLRKTKTNEYILSVLLDFNEPIIPIKPKNLIVGIDLGVKDFIKTSKGRPYENLKFKKAQEKKIKRKQRELSRREKGSKNREKSRLELAKIYKKLNNRKEYYLHSIVNELISENQVIVIEDLNVSGMLKNHKLAAAIQAASFYRFQEILKYKAEWNGRIVIKVSRWFASSKKCSNCKYKKKDLKLSDREWTCPECGTHHDRDLNAAINIEHEGYRLLLEDKDGLYKEIKEKIGMSLPEFKPLEICSVDDPVKSV